MSRARGANAVLAMAFESVYGTPPGSGFFKVPYASASIGDQQNLVASDLLGQGREPSDPSLDVINNDGDIVVPVDLRNFGLWLKGMFGAPTTVAGICAAGSIAFSANPVASSTLTINAKTITFVASGPTGLQCLIGATLADTMVNLVQLLNGSTDVALTVATYGLDSKGTTLTISYDVPGTAGNSFALVAGSSPASNGTVSAATLAGGSATGGYQHTFKSGATNVPSLSVEVGMPDVPSFAMNYGISLDKMAIALARSGLLNATISTVGQGEATRTASTGAGSPSTLVLSRFSQFTGGVTRLGAPLGDLVSGNVNMSNNLDKVEVIRPDGRIAGVDAAEAAYNGQAVLRFKDSTLMNLAANGTPIDLAYSWQIAANQSLRIFMPRVWLPRPKAPITGPGGVQATFDWQASKDSVAGYACAVTLCNDVASY